MDADDLEDRVGDPRLGHPYFGGVDEMVTAWAWHLLDAEPAAALRRPAHDGASRRYDLLGAAPEMGELVVPRLRLPEDLPGWCGELLVCFVDVLIQDQVARIWDGGGPAAVTAHLAGHDLAPDALRAATVDDMVFLGMVAMEVMVEVLDARDRILAIAALCTA
jgi:hypothetical protein